ncbi:uncharacterized protein [Ptychodera flava]|uniref:uncharacterized protein n=1 Tax=Ptychodera flava TaxID=63121 RepID=UPI00396A7479
MAKWVSVLSHMVNVHTHNDTLFPACLHGHLQGREARKQWLQPCKCRICGSVTMVKLERLLTSTALLQDIRQTSGQDMYCFSYHGQSCRTLLAISHFNENAGHNQQHTEGGEARYGLQFPKWKKSGYTVHKILPEPSFGKHFKNSHWKLCYCLSAGHILDFWFSGKLCHQR